ncbi:hypothetical protein ACFVWG_32535 [Kribbella sp. NPDC058245]|uniref:hypothetical protein n=1 Tax=Kribbella sp. NPDC058245 TaxID=3346399 RepID=UPI0036F1799A
MRKKIPVIVGSVMLAVGVALTPTTAMADPAPPTAEACPTSTWYDIVGHTAYFVPADLLPTFKDGPGGDLTVGLTENYTSTATISGGTSAEIGGVIAKAKVEVSASLSQAVSLTVKHDFHRIIPNGKYGHAQYGSWGQQVTWRQYFDGADCTTKLRKSGTARLPSRAEVGWKYWESNT